MPWDLLLVDDDKLLFLTTCPDCGGTQAVVNLYGEPDLCRTCVLPPRDPFPEHAAD